MMLEQLAIHITKKINLDTDLTPFTKKTSSKWIIDLNVNSQKIMGENLDDLGFSKDFSKTQPNT